MSRHLVREIIFCHQGVRLVWVLIKLWHPVQDGKWAAPVFEPCFRPVVFSCGPGVNTRWQSCRSKANVLWLRITCHTAGNSGTQIGSGTGSRSHLKKFLGSAAGLLWRWFILNPFQGRGEKLGISELRVEGKAVGCSTESWSWWKIERGWDRAALPKPRCEAGEELGRPGNDQMLGF